MTHCAKYVQVVCLLASAVGVGGCAESDTQPRESIRDPLPLVSTITLKAEGEVSGAGRKGQDVILTIVAPDQNPGPYGGTRFDWSGMVLQARWNGHTFFAAGQLPPVGGHAEEFGTRNPLGYYEARVGETFLKIGVGQLRKPEEPRYWPDKHYEIVNAPRWRVIERPDSVEFFQEQVAVRGYAYEYRKKITISANPPGFMIERELKNTGEKMLETNFSCYPAVALDGRVIGPEYRVGFNFPPRVRGGGKLPDANAEIRGNELLFRHVLGEGLSPGGAITWDLEGYAQVETKEIRIGNRISGTQLTMLPDYGFFRFVLSATGASISPQPHLEIALKPDEFKKWKTQFVFTGP